MVVDNAIGCLSVTAFRQSQRDVLPAPEPVPEAPFDPGGFVTYQVTLDELEREGQLNFGRLKKFDVLAKQPMPEGLGEGGSLRVPLTSSRDATLWMSAF